MSTTIHQTGFGREALVRLAGQSRNGDYKGTVFTATRILKDHGVSINALWTTTFNGPVSGEAMFATNVDVVLPRRADRVALVQALEGIATDIAVDIEEVAHIAA